MYAAGHVHPDGASTARRMARTAAEYGFDGLVVRNHGDEQSEFEPEPVIAETDIDVVRGIEIRTDDIERARGLVGNYRSKRTVVAVHGGDPELNRFAVEQPTVDVLAHPMHGDGDFNHVLAHAAAKNDVRVELSLRSVLADRGGSRVRSLRNLRKLHELLEDAGTPYVVSADPDSHLSIRAPRELIALGEQIDIGADTVRDGLSEWGRLVERNQERTEASFVEPGVRIEERDTE